MTITTFSSKFDYDYDDENDRDYDDFMTADDYDERRYERDGWRESESCRQRF
jgi:hypothetical protein